MEAWGYDKSPIWHQNRLQTHRSRNRRTITSLRPDSSCGRSRNVANGRRSILDVPRVCQRRFLTSSFILSRSGLSWKVGGGTTGPFFGARNLVIKSRTRWEGNAYIVRWMSSWCSGGAFCRPCGRTHLVALKEDLRWQSWGFQDWSCLPLSCYSA